MLVKQLRVPRLSRPMVQKLSTCVQEDEGSHAEGEEEDSMEEHSHEHSHEHEGQLDEDEEGSDEEHDEGTAAGSFAKKVPTHPCACWRLLGLVHVQHQL